jgi:hypothetical protein
LRQGLDLVDQSFAVVDRAQLELEVGVAAGAPPAGDVGDVGVPAEYDLGDVEKDAGLVANGQEQGDSLGEVVYQ